MHSQCLNLKDASAKQKNELTLPQVPTGKPALFLLWKQIALRMPFLSRAEAVSSQIVKQIPNKFLLSTAASNEQQCREGTPLAGCC
jgi:hypothetical protein